MGLMAYQFQLEPTLRPLISQLRHRCILQVKRLHPCPPHAHQLAVSVHHGTISRRRPLYRRPLSHHLCHAALAKGTLADTCALSPHSPHTPCAPHHPPTTRQCQVLVTLAVDNTMPHINSTWSDHTLYGADMNIGTAASNHGPLELPSQSKYLQHLSPADHRIDLHISQSRAEQSDKRTGAAKLSHSGNHMRAS